MLVAMHCRMCSGQGHGAVWCIQCVSCVDDMCLYAVVCRM